MLELLLNDLVPSSSEHISSVLGLGNTAPLNPPVPWGLVALLVTVRGVLG